MFNLVAYLLGISLLKFCPVAATKPEYPLVVTEVPNHVRPYVLPYLTEPGVQLGDDIIRLPVTNASSGGAFSLFRLNGQVNDAVPTHYHSRFYESWFSIKGRVTLWANQEARILGRHDFGAVPQLINRDPNVHVLMGDVRPTFQNHSFQLNEPDSEFLAFITPGGFEPFYLSVSVPWNNTSNAPFPPDRPLPVSIPPGPILDYIPVNYTLNNNLHGGTTSQTTPWHTGNNTLPTSDRKPFYIASNWGPKYLHRGLGQVIAPVMTVEQSGQSSANYTMTISTVVMRRRLANETVASQAFDKPQVVVVLEGQLTINMIGQNVSMSTGDVAFVPAHTDFRYWSTVAFTKFYLGSSGPALGHRLISEAESWDYAVFPSYIGEGS